MVGVQRTPAATDREPAVETIYSPELKAHLTVDDNRRVRHILHTEYPVSEAGTARRAASDYLREVAGTLDVRTS